MFLQEITTRRTRLYRWLQCRLGRHRWNSIIYSGGLNQKIEGWHSCIWCGKQRPYDPKTVIRW